jgi:hypothetical protein
VTVCHRTGSKKHRAHTITVAASAVKAHLRHGDTLGPCTGTEKPKPKHHDDDAAPSTPQGKGHGHGDDGDHGDHGDHGKGHHK